MTKSWMTCEEHLKRIKKDLEEIKAQLLSELLAGDIISVTTNFHDGYETQDVTIRVKRAKEER